jgi:hypothetical protein
MPRFAMRRSIIVDTVIEFYSYCRRPSAVMPAPERMIAIKDSQDKRIPRLIWSS